MQVKNTIAICTCLALTSRVIDMYMFMCYCQCVKDARLIALIEPGQMKALKARSKREKISLAEVVRRALEMYLKKGGK